MQCPNHSPLPKQDWFDWEQWEPHEAKANVKLAISNRKFNIRLTGYCWRPEIKWHTVGDYSANPLQRPQITYNPLLNPGLALIVHVQIGALATALHLLEWGKLPEAWENQYLCCRATWTKDIPHILLECLTGIPNAIISLPPCSRSWGPLTLL